MREPTTGRTTLPRRQEARGPGRVAEEPDLQALLADAVRSLAEATRATAVVAWGPRAGGAAAVLAACFEGPGPGPPDPAVHAAIAELREATDLGAPGLPLAAREAARRFGFAAAVPVRAGGGAPHALLLLAGPEDRPGRVRPRTLAALDALARRLEIPIGAALARQRLAALDEEVQHLDRLAALGGLVAEIVHEIRNPLVSVKTFLQLLPDRAGDPEFHQSFFEVATEELRRIERLLEVVLEHARPRSADPEAPADVVRVIESVARLLSHRAAEHGVAIETQIAPDLPRVAIAEDPLRQVVLNLAMNALEASPPGTAVEIRARRAEDGIEIRVLDRGPGVPAPQRARVFEAFVSSKAERPGGLGLAISRRLVEGAGGRIGVADREQGGAVFDVWLPAR